MNTDTERARFEKWAEEQGYETRYYMTAGAPFSNKETQAAWLSWQARAALPSAPSEGPSDRVKELSTLVEELLFAAENADETGYVTDVGFIDLDKLHDRARAALKGDAR
jgi:hypothetical protein